MTAVSLLVAFLLSAASESSPVSRVDAARAIERARYAFVIGATTPFDEAYPRAVFEQRVRRELAEEQLLAEFFQVRVSAGRVAEEYERIDKTTKGPEQWQAIKQALGHDRRLIEEAFCRPVLVSRTLRARFAFDSRIHIDAHRQARAARAAFLAGGNTSGAAEVLLDRESVDPEVACALKSQLRRRGDVSTILEHSDRFDIFRLVEITPARWRVEMVRVPKVRFNSWFESLR